MALDILRVRTNYERYLVSWEPQSHWCGTQSSRPSLKPTATLTASSSNLSPHEAIGNAKSQSPLCCEEAARKDATDYYYCHYYYYLIINIIISIVIGPYLNGL